MVYSVLLAIHVIITLLLVVIIILQRNDGDGLGLSASSSSPMTSVRSSSNPLTRVTAFLATAFILSSLGLSLVHQESDNTSIVDQIEEESPVSEKVKSPVEEPGVPSVPLRE